MYTEQVNADYERARQKHEQELRHAEKDQSGPSAAEIFLCCCHLPCSFRFLPASSLAQRRPKVHEQR